MQQNSQLPSGKGKDGKLDDLVDSLSQISLADDVCSQLKALQCPFTWKLKEMMQHPFPKPVTTRLEEKEEEMDGEEGPFLLLRQFGVQLALCYEKWCEGDILGARQRQGICKNLIESSEEVPFLDGLRHISRACAAHLSYFSKIVSESHAILKTIIPFEKLDAVNRACVIGMRGIVLMEYGYHGTSQAVSYIEEALELDPSSAEWHFLLGKFLGRVRRINAFNEIPEKRELEALEKAVEMSSCSGYCTFLAQTYMETASRVYSLNRENILPFKGILRAMNGKAAEYYRKSLEMAPDSSHINIRCALGFLKLPHPFRDEVQAKRCIDKALKLAPNNAMAHHVAGKYYERIGNIEAAKCSYKSAGQHGAYGAYMDFMRLEFRTDKNYDPLPLLNKMLSTFAEEPYQVGILSQMGAYYYLMQNDLKKAVICWLQIIDKDYDTDRLRTCRPVCVFIKNTIDLLQIALDESRLALSQKSLPSEDAALYKRLISKYEGTKLLCNPPRAHRKKIIEESVNLLKETKHSSASGMRGKGGRRGF